MLVKQTRVNSALGLLLGGTIHLVFFLAFFGAIWYAFTDRFWTREFFFASFLALVLMLFIEIALEKGKELAEKDLAIKLQDDPNFRREYEKQREEEKKRAREAERRQELRWERKGQEWERKQQQWGKEREEATNRARALWLENVDEMTGVDFERYLIHLLNHQSYQAKHTGRAGDGGVDIIAERGGKKFAVQAKRQKQPVSRQAVSDAVAGQALHGCVGSMVITSSTFTLGAQKVAGANGCILIDRAILADWIIAFKS